MFMFSFDAFYLSHFSLRESGLLESPSVDVFYLIFNIAGLKKLTSPDLDLTFFRLHFVLVLCLDGVDRTAAICFIFGLLCFEIHHVFV